MRMQVEEVQPASKKKKALAAVLALLAVAALSWGGYKAWLAFSVPAMPQTVEDIEDLLDDARYQNMSSHERRPYVEHMNEMFGSLDEDGRRRLRESFRESEIDARDRMDMGIQMMRTFHGTLANAPTPEARDQAIDGMIAMMDSQRGGADEGARPSREASDEDREQGERMMADFLDSGDPQAIGYMSELFKLIEQRRAERGLPPMGG